ncbi:MAG: hypothetical protein Q7T63_21565 [Burkholderiaceae bacterium]|nr:hypothetical protein [Burkholderiaceae bacterium]
MRGNPSLLPRGAVAALACIAACACCAWGVAQAASAGVGMGTNAGAGMARSVGEMLRLETENALAETRRRAAAAALDMAVEAKPGAAADGQFRAAGASGRSAHFDTVELLGTWRRGDGRTADLALNGVVTQVGTGDRVGAYQVKAVATHCIHLLYRQHTEMLRCISGQKP